jgi:hypothetical protein
MKKFILIAIVAALALTGGAFAYTFTTATTTIGVTAIQSDFAEVSTNGTYSPPTVFGRFTGTWPTGTLFDISPDPNYTGDLVVKVYLVNTGALIRYYQHLNLALEFQDSTGTASDNQAEVQVLNLSNAEVTFDWVNGTGTGPYYVEVTGGGYRLHPWRTMSGGSVTPQIWCEVTQR